MCAASLIASLPLKWASPIAAGSPGFPDDGKHPKCLKLFEDEVILERGFGGETIVDAQRRAGF